jgi:hypothetical protein
MGMSYVYITANMVGIEKSLTLPKQAQLLGLEMPLRKSWKLCGRLG